MNMRYAIVAISIVTPACPPSPLPPEPPVVVFVGDAGVDEPADLVDGGWSTCARACSKLRVAGCPEGKAASDGTTCTAACKRAELLGIDLASLCVAKAATKAEIQACRTSTGGLAVRCRD